MAKKAYSRESLQGLYGHFKAERAAKLKSKLTALPASPERMQHHKLNDKLARFIWNAPSLGLVTGVWLYSLTLPILMHQIGYAQHKSTIHTIIEIPVALVLALLLLCLVMLVSVYSFKTIYALGRKTLTVIRSISG